MACPNKNLQEWKDLVAARGEDMAYFLWDQYGGFVPSSTEEETFEMKDSPVTRAAIQKLDNHLLNFMKQFGVRSKEFNSLKTKLGIDSLGATDVLNKLIWITKNRDAKTVPEEVGHMAVMLMGEKHPEIAALFTEITTWEGYQDVYDKYMPIYKNEKQVKMDAMAKLISEALVRQYDAVGTDKSLINRAYTALKNFIDNLLDSFSIADAMAYSSRIADKIALNLLNENIDYLGGLTPSQEALNYTKAVRENPFAKGLIDFFTQKGMSLTGSLAIAGANETIYRNNENPIHDLDFIVDNESDYNNVQDDLKKMNAVPAHAGWGNKTKGYVTQAFLIPAEGFTIQVLQKSSRGFVEKFVVVDKNGRQQTPTQKNSMSVDFFIYDENTGSPSTRGEFNSFSDIYHGKLGLSREGKNERTFQRDKDQEDYRLSKPKRIYESKKEFIYQQSDEMPSSEASTTTVEKVLEVIKKMGINVVSLNNYAKANPGVSTTDVNGLADLTQKVIAIATGREGVTLTEEMVHIATAILEQTNPKLITNMISKIDRFEIFKRTLATYRHKPAYQLGNGKPDIRKIKKEAVDKLIAELIVNQGDDVQGFPELANEMNRGIISRWWNSIKDFIRGSYSSASIDIFKTAASVIMNDEFGTAQDIKSTGVFAQVKNKGKIGDNAELDKMYDTISKKDKLLRLIDSDPEDRHYDFNIDGVWTRVKQTVTELISKSKTFPKLKGVKLKHATDKMNWGTEGHRYLERYFEINLIDENGFAKEFTETPVDSTLEPAVALKVQEFAKELIASYSSGTRFIIERKLINESVEGMLASTVDFIAIEPTLDKNGNPTYKVDVLDWKFTAINKDENDDIPFYSQKSWKAQMGEYTKILYKYGLEPSHLRKARMIPFIVEYDTVIPLRPESGIYPHSVEIGKVDSLKETNVYLMPVPVKFETTGNSSVDNLVASLFAYYDKTYSKVASTIGDKAAKSIRLNKLSTAIRQLQVTLNFQPLVQVGNDFINTAAKTVEEFENIDYAEISPEVLDKKLKDLVTLQASAAKFIGLDQVFIDTYSTKLDDEQKKVLKSLESISNKVKRMDPRIVTLQREFAVQLGIEEGYVDKLDSDAMLKPELPLGFMAKTFLEGSKLSNKIIKLASNLLMRAKALVEHKFIQHMDTFSPLLVALENESRAMGVSAFSRIGTMSNGTLKLIKKLDKDFLEAMDTAREKKNKKFILANIDEAAYTKEVTDFMAQNVKAIKEHLWNVDPIENDAEIEFRIRNMRNSVDIKRNTFTGWQNFNFRELIKNAIIEEGHYSEEYKEMVKSTAALNMWEHFVKLNKWGRDMGYLTKEGTSFFPLIEATTLQKIGAADDKFAEVKNIFKDLYTARIEERKGYTKVDPETNESRREVPTYFKKTDKKVEQLSQDLGLIGTLWTKALLEYESSTAMENTMLTLYSVENAKGGLIDKGDGHFDVVRVNENAPMLKQIIDDSIYGLSEDTSGIVSKSIAVAGSYGATDSAHKERRAVNIKKAIESSNILVRSLGVGLKYGIAVANWAGQQFQAYIMAGGVYLFKEYSSNHLSLMTNSISTEQRALIDMMIPLSEDIVKVMRRKMAGKYSRVAQLNSWSFSDIMQITNSFPEIGLQMVNAMSFNENTMVVGGRLVNIRDHVRAQDRKTREGYTIEQRKELKNTFQSRVDALKAEKSIVNTVQITDGKVVIPGVSDKEIARYKVRIMDYSRNLNGQMDEDNKASYRRNILARSFMMFRTWIPKLVSVRTLDINYNYEQEQWEYGRSRLWLKTWKEIGLWNVLQMRELVLGTEKGMEIMDKMLEEKKQAYFMKTGQKLTISKEEFYDLMSYQLSNQVKELRMLISIALVALAAKSAEPPEDSTRYEKNMYKSAIKLLNKISDELWFYYNPMTFESISKGNILPALNLLTSVSKIFTHVWRLGEGYVMEDQEKIDKAHPLKYFLNIVPGAYQWQTDFEPHIFPEYSKEKGVIITKEARRN